MLFAKNSSEASAMRDNGHNVYDPFTAAAADRDLLLEELYRFRQSREQHDAAKENAQRQSLVAMKGMQKTVSKLEEENERLMAQLNKEREQFMEQLKGVESQLDKATSDNEHLTLCLRRAEEQLARLSSSSTETEGLRKAFDIEQIATQEAIAMCESAEADNDRLCEEVENLQQQLQEARAMLDDSHCVQIKHCVDSVGPLRTTIAELIYGILEDFVEEEQDDEKSPVVEELEKTCHIMTHLPVQAAADIGFVSADYAAIIRSFNAFRELLVAATQMAQEAVQQAQDAVDQAHEVDSNSVQNTKPEGQIQQMAPAVNVAELNSAKETVAELQQKVAELEESLSKAKEVAKTARQDVGEVKGQLRRYKNENEATNKKFKEQEEHVGTLEKELKHVKGQLDQIKLQKREAYTKSRKAESEREEHVKQIQELKDNSDHLRREMEQRMLATCEEQEEYTNVMAELRVKLERELAQLQREHQLAEENNTALMEDRVNLIQQLAETKIQAQESLQKRVEEIEEKANKKMQEHAELEAKNKEMTKALENSACEAEDHRQTCEKYRIDLEATLQRVSEQAEEVTNKQKELDSKKSECEELHALLAKQKEEFDSDLMELNKTVEKMEQSAADREQAMAERAEEALERAINHARAEARKQSEEAINQALGQAQAQSAMLVGSTEEKLQQACRQIKVLEAQLAEELQERCELQQKLNDCRQQIVEARQRVVQAEEAAALARSECLRHGSVNERAAQVHAVSEIADRRFGTLPNGNGRQSQVNSPVKSEKSDGDSARPTNSSMSWLKKMRKGKDDKENDGTDLTGKRDASHIRGKLQGFARGQSIEHVESSPIKSDPSESRDYAASPGTEKRQLAKLERKAKLQQLKQRGKA